MRNQQISVTVDAVIFYQNNDIIELLLIQRKKDPYKGQWALPGGFLEEGEEMEEGARRELQEETGLNIEKLEQIKAFGTPGRDPRGRTISIAFMGVINEARVVKGSDDAKDAKWFNINDLPPLAFDHKKIINAAQELI